MITGHRKEAVGEGNSTTWWTLVAAHGTVSEGERESATFNVIPSVQLETASRALP